MPELIIKNLQGRLLRLSERQSVLQACQENYIDWMHACGGKGRCTTCAFNVLEGEDQLSAPTHVEEKYRSEGRLLSKQRLACQTRCKGTAVIEVPPENQLPHLTYGYE